MTETTIFGLRFFTGTMDGAAEEALALIRARRGAYAVTPNPEIVLRAEKDPALFAALREAALCLPDGATSPAFPQCITSCIPAESSGTFTQT